MPKTVVDFNNFSIKNIIEQAIKMAYNSLSEDIFATRIYEEIVYIVTMKYISSLSFFDYYYYYHYCGSSYFNTLIDAEIERIFPNVELPSREPHSMSYAGHDARALSKKGQISNLKENLGIFVYITSFTFITAGLALVWGIFYFPTKVINFGDIDSGLLASMVATKEDNIYEMYYIKMKQGAQCVKDINGLLNISSVKVLYTNPSSGEMILLITGEDSLTQLNNMFSSGYIARTRFDLDSQDNSRKYFEEKKESIRLLLSHAPFDNSQNLKYCPSPLLSVKRYIIDIDKNITWIPFCVFLLKAIPSFECRIVSIYEHFGILSMSVYITENEKKIIADISGIKNIYSDSPIGLA